MSHSLRTDCLCLLCPSSGKDHLLCPFCNWLSIRILYFDFFYLLHIKLPYRAYYHPQNCLQKCLHYHKQLWHNLAAYRFQSNRCNTIILLFLSTLFRVSFRWNILHHTNHQFKFLSFFPFRDIFHLWFLQCKWISMQMKTYNSCHFLGHSPTFLCKHPHWCIYTILNLVFFLNKTIPHRYHRLNISRVRTHGIYH